MPKTAEDTKAIYNAELKESLERDFVGQYVAIVSETRRHYIRPTFLAAAMAARESEPDYVPFVIRIGHDAAFHIGKQWLSHLQTQDFIVGCGNPAAAEYR